MDKTQYLSMAKAWQFTEEHAARRQSSETADARALAQESGLPQSSAAQSAMLAMLARVSGARSVITVGTASVVEAMELVRGLHGEGMLTAVESSAQGIAVIRKAFDLVPDQVATRLRAVHASADAFLPRLNAGDYDLIVVSGDASNYTPAFEQAHRLLRRGGFVVFTDTLALASPTSVGGVFNPANREDKAVFMRGFVDVVESDERFDATFSSAGTGMLVAVKN